MRTPFLQTTAAGGELGPQLQARSNLEAFYRTVKRVKNFIIDNSGEARFREGTPYVSNTQGNNKPHLESFVFNTEQSYLLSFTDGLMRVFKDDGAVLETDIAITGSTQASPCVITAAGHGFSDGDEVFISGVEGMTRLNGRFFKVANAATNTFEIHTIEGVYVNSTGYDAYTSGGTVARLYTLAVPFAADDLANIVADQQEDTMYITCAKTAGGSYRPQKLTRSGHASWSISDVSFVDGPYYPENTSTTTLTLSGTTGSVTVTASAATFSATDIGRLIHWHDGTNYTWLTITAYTDSTHVTATISGANAAATTATKKWALGIFTDTLGWPKLVTFYENRAVYANTDTFPRTFWGSKAAEITSDFDTFTPGTNDNSPYNYRIASGQANGIRFMKGGDQFMLAGTYGAEHRINGGSTDAAITPTAISVKGFSYFGVSSTQPVLADNNVMYVQRNQRTIRSIVYDPIRDGYVSDDKTILAPHITEGNIIRMAFQAGPPNILWCVRGDGVLIGLTYEQRQQVLAWQRHAIGEGIALVEDVAVTPQNEGPDRVWIAVKITTGGTTRRFICYLADPVEYPDRDDYILTYPTSQSPADIEAAKNADDAIFFRAVYEAQKKGFHLDCGLTYDGSLQTVSMTPSYGAATVDSTDILFTASGNVFTSSMIGREIWGAAGGRASITGYTSPTEVTCLIREAFPGISTISAGDWYLTTSTVSGLDHLEGMTVRANTDGGATESFTVSNGSITVNSQYSIIHVGLPYHGLFITNDLAGQAADGSNDGRVKSVSEVSVYLRNSLGCAIGTNPYRMDEMVFRSSEDQAGRPPPLFTGWKTTSVADEASPNKRLYIQQNNPQPCIIQSVRATCDARSITLR